MQDPLETLSDEQLYLLAADISLQLEKGAGTRPIVYLLAQQRARAVQAIIGLINADPDEPKIIRGFQQEAKLYHDLMTNCRDMLDRGREADRRIAERDAEAMAEHLEGMSEEERKALNIETRGDD